MTTDDYTTAPVKVAIWYDPYVELVRWRLDGRDSDDRPTERCWGFATWREALNHVPSFCQEYESLGGVGV